MINQDSNSNIESKINEDISPTKKLKGLHLKIVLIIAVIWSFFQLWYASPLPFILDFGKIIDVPARSVHLAFGLVLCFLAYPGLKKNRDKPISIFDIFLVITSFKIISVSFELFS